MRSKPALSASSKRRCVEAVFLFVLRLRSETWLMSPIGPKRTYQSHSAMSAFRGKADMVRSGSIIPSKFRTKFARHVRAAAAKSILGGRQNRPENFSQARGWRFRHLCCTYQAVSAMTMATIRMGSSTVGSGAASAPGSIKGECLLRFLVCRGNGGRARGIPDQASRRRARQCYTSRGQGRLNR